MKVDDDDSLSSWKKSRELANELEKAGTFNLRNGGKPKPKESQRRDVLRACYLAVDGVIETDWLREAATSTRDSKPTENAYSYFLKVLRETCTHHGIEFGKAAAGVEVPQNLMRRAVDRPGGREGGAVEGAAAIVVEDSPTAAHQDCAPCVPEGLDDPTNPTGSPQMSVYGAWRGGRIGKRDRRNVASGGKAKVLTIV